jgi:hypothetical protein
VSHRSNSLRLFGQSQLRKAWKQRQLCPCAVVVKKYQIHSLDVGLFLLLVDIKVRELDLPPLTCRESTERDWRYTLLFV